MSASRQLAKGARLAQIRATPSPAPHVTPEIPTPRGPLAGLSWTWNFESHSLPLCRPGHWGLGTGATEPAGTGKGGRHRGPAAPSLPWT